MTDIPKDPNQFKRWADAECGKWPASLTIEAAFAADAFKYRNAVAELKAFAERYETWRAAQPPRS